jgi:hypothetical protein
MNVVAVRACMRISRSLALGLLATSASLLLSSPSLASITVTQTTDPAALTAALGGGPLTINSVSTPTGDPNQFGTHTNFSLIKTGVVISTGLATDTVGPPSPNDTPASDMSTPLGHPADNGTPEFNAYGIGHITNFTASYDVATLQVNFTLASPTAIAFNFVFGSIEYPNWVNQYADSFLAFLDGTNPSSQIIFDSTGAAVSVGTSFANQVITSNSETAFGAPHGILPPLTTTSGVLAAGQHTILLEIGDANDHILDSAVFLADFRATYNPGGGPHTDPTVPEPSTLVSLGLSALVLVGYWRRRRKPAA